MGLNEFGINLLNLYRFSGTCYVYLFKFRTVLWFSKFIIYYLISYLYLMYIPRSLSVCLKITHLFSRIFATYKCQ